jgi:hypothetical protein
MEAITFNAIKFFTTVSINVLRYDILLHLNINALEQIS